MKTDLCLTNESFSFLKNSSDFLNIILNNIDCCVLLLDKEMKLRAFNDSTKTIFSNRKDEDLLYIKCGEAIGCAYQIEEQKDCGTTSKCKNCKLRISALKSYMNNETIYKERISKPFLNYTNEKVEKKLQFSTRLFIFRHEKYIIMLINDITNLVNPEKESVSPIENQTYSDNRL
jgi:nitrogen fixation/metabolism regulation signal transduction histidine kinase